MAGHSFLENKNSAIQRCLIYRLSRYRSRPHVQEIRQYFQCCKRVIPINLQHFLATPEYMDDEDQICWHIEKWQQHPTRLSELSGAEYDRYKGILDDTIKYTSPLLWI